MLPFILSRDVSVQKEKSHKQMQEVVLCLKETLYREACLGLRLASDWSRLKKRRLPAASLFLPSRVLKLNLDSLSKSHTPRAGVALICSL
jgi:hypothetical protein